ncbi:MAG: ATP-binding cassette domain-containing protein [Dermatophilaceae bacterium]|jgi:ABC-2 type transport system ATP-binding protein|nr:ATP-binding cassette domain-containing protein [Actinomycetales bacterium]MBP8879502.1 ATP-binding cassette domain-containing protein [Dermatophilaceae bacterium]MBP9918195.1 ATP-binding cassette domain-containing protein [Dermatophilaceae bacterium]
MTVTTAYPSPSSPPPPSGPILGVPLHVRDLTKRFGAFTAVDRLTFTVEPGRVTGFLGPNGAGKTTTMRMLLGLVRPTSGVALIGDHQYQDLPNPMRVVGSALEATNFHPGRSGRDHLRVLADASDTPLRRVDELLELVGIPAAAKQRAGGYSMGMRQRLGLAAALLGDPAVVILDEPANGLDPEGIRWLREFLRFLAKEGRTVLISSHMLAEADQIVDDVVIIANGQIVAQGSIADLRGEPTVYVRTPDVAALASALTARGVLSSPGERGGLIVRTEDPARVGDIALEAGMPIHELHPQASDLEDLFFRLTDTPEHRNRNTVPGIPHAVPERGEQR